MKKGTKVKWTLKDGTKGGHGTVITDEVDGEVQVKVEGEWGTGQTWENEVHYVISCTVTWLTVVA